MHRSDSDTRPAAYRTLVDLLRHRAAVQPDDTAYIYLRDGFTDEERLTYGELDARARRIATALVKQGARGRTVLINHLPGLDYLTSFFGCVYAGAIAVPVYPPRFNPKLERLTSIVADSRPAAALTSATVLAALKGGIESHPLLGNIPWLRTEEEEADSAEDHWEFPDTPENGLAFVQYTSGSTSVPKGVMLSHANILSNLECICTAFETSGESVGTVWLPPYHDMGMIGGILAPLYGGFPVILMSPYSFLQRPHRWLQAISRYGATISGGPTFAYDLCVRRINERQMEELDLSRWKVAFCGAEPIRTEVVEAFSRKFSACGFRHEAWYPCYGLAEVTLMASGGKVSAPPVVSHVDSRQMRMEGVAREVEPGAPSSWSYVGCGTAALHHTLRIVNPETALPCAEGEVGEVWVSGPSVAQGYWNRPEESEAHFRATIAGERDGRTYLRTGDLGFLQDGELFVTGRIKDVIIFRGANYYPQDIELTAGKSHQALKPGAGAAFAVVGESGERLVIVHELARGHRDVDLDQVVEQIRENVLEQHGISPYAVSLVSPNSIPFTSSGKVQRFACRDLFLGGDLKELKRFVEV